MAPKATKNISWTLFLIKINPIGQNMINYKYNLVYARAIFGQGKIDNI